MMEGSVFDGQRIAGERQSGLELHDPTDFVRDKKVLEPSFNERFEMGDGLLGVLENTLSLRILLQAKDLFDEDEGANLKRSDLENHPKLKNKPELDEILKRFDEFQNEYDRDLNGRQNAQDEKETRPGVRLNVFRGNMMTKIVPYVNLIFGYEALDENNAIANEIPAFPLGRMKLDLRRLMFEDSVENTKPTILRTRVDAYRLLGPELYQKMQEKALLLESVVALKKHAGKKKAELAEVLNSFRADIEANEVGELTNEELEQKRLAVETLLKNPLLKLGKMKLEEIGMLFDLGDLVMRVIDFSNEHDEHKRIELGLKIQDEAARITGTELPHDIPEQMIKEKKIDLYLGSAATMSRSELEKNWVKYVTLKRQGAKKE